LPASSLLSGSGSGTAEEVIALLDVEGSIAGFNVGMLIVLDLGLVPRNIAYYLALGSKTGGKR
jgi:hypothetical protein